MLVAEKKTIWPWEERLMIMLVLGLFNALGQIQIGFYNCCKFIGQQFSFTKRQTLILLGHFLKKVISNERNYPSGPLAACGREFFLCASPLFAIGAELWAQPEVRLRS